MLKLSRVKPSRVKPSRVKLTDINPHLVCVLCSGYLIDATTIIECLHSFCRRCIIRYLETSKFCPICDVQVHKSRPLDNLRSDAMLQKLVYKLVPGLYQDEMERRRRFYRGKAGSGSDARGSTRDSDEGRDELESFSTDDRGDLEPFSTNDRGDVLDYRLMMLHDEKISLVLQHCDGLPAKKCPNYKKREKVCDKRYLLCPAAVNISHLSKFIKCKFDLDTTYEVEFFHSGDILHDDVTLMEIAYIYGWKKIQPLRLFYAVMQNSSAVQLSQHVNNISIVSNKASDEQPVKQRKFMGSIIKSANPEYSRCSETISKPLCGLSTDLHGHVTHSAERSSTYTALNSPTKVATNPSPCDSESNANAEKNLLLDHPQNAVKHLVKRQGAGNKEDSISPVPTATEESNTAGHISSVDEDTGIYQNQTDGAESVVKEDIRTRPSVGGPLVPLEVTSSKQPVKAVSASQGEVPMPMPVSASQGEVPMPMPVSASQGDVPMPQVKDTVAYASQSITKVAGNFTSNSPKRIALVDDSESMLGDTVTTIKNRTELRTEQVFSSSQSYHLTDQPENVSGVNENTNTCMSNREAPKPMLSFAESKSEERTSTCTASGYTMNSSTNTVSDSGARDTHCDNAVCDTTAPVGTDRSSSEKLSLKMDETNNNDVLVNKMETDKIRTDATQNNMCVKNGQPSCEEGGVLQGSGMLTLVPVTSSSTLTVGSVVSSCTGPDSTGALSYNTHYSVNTNGSVVQGVPHTVKCPVVQPKSKKKNIAVNRPNGLPVFNSPSQQPRASSTVHSNRKLSPIINIASRVSTSKGLTHFARFTQPKLNFGSNTLQLKVAPPGLKIQCSNTGNGNTVYSPPVASYVLVPTTSVPFTNGTRQSIQLINTPVSAFLPLTANNPLHQVVRLSAPTVHGKPVPLLPAQIIPSSQGVPVEVTTQCIETPVNPLSITTASGRVTTHDGHNKQHHTTSKMVFPNAYSQQPMDKETASFILKPYSARMPVPIAQPSPGTSAMSLSDMNRPTTLKSSATTHSPAASLSTPSEVSVQGMNTIQNTRSSTSVVLNELSIRGIPDDMTSTDPRKVASPTGNTSKFIIPVCGKAQCSPTDRVTVQSQPSINVNVPISTQQISPSTASLSGVQPQVSTLNVPDNTPVTHIRSSNALQINVPTIASGQSASDPCSVRDMNLCSLGSIEVGSTKAAPTQTRCIFTTLSGMQQCETTPTKVSAHSNVKHPDISTNIEYCQNTISTHAKVFNTSMASSAITDVTTDQHKGQPRSVSVQPKAETRVVTVQHKEYASFETVQPKDKTRVEHVQPKDQKTVETFQVQHASTNVSAEGLDKNSKTVPLQTIIAPTDVSSHVTASKLPCSSTFENTTSIGHKRINQTSCNPGFQGTPVVNVLNSSNKELKWLSTCATSSHTITVSSIQAPIIKEALSQPPMKVSSQGILSPRKKYIPMKLGPSGPIIPANKISSKQAKDDSSQQTVTTVAAPISHDTKGNQNTSESLGTKVTRKDEASVVTPHYIASMAAPLNASFMATPRYTASMVTSPYTTSVTTPPYTTAMVTPHDTAAATEIDIAESANIQASQQSGNDNLLKRLGRSLTQGDRASAKSPPSFLNEGTPYKRGRRSLPQITSAPPDDGSSNPNESSVNHLIMQNTVSLSKRAKRCLTQNETTSPKRLCQSFSQHEKVSQPVGLDVTAPKQVSHSPSQNVSAANTFVSQAVSEIELDPTHVGQALGTRTAQMNNLATSPNIRGHTTISKTGNSVQSNDPLPGISTVVSSPSQNQPLPFPSKHVTKPITPKKLPDYTLYRNCVVTTKLANERVGDAKDAGLIGDQSVDVYSFDDSSSTNPANKNGQVRNDKHASPATSHINKIIVKSKKKHKFPKAVSRKASDSDVQHHKMNTDLNMPQSTLKGLSADDNAIAGASQFPSTNIIYEIVSSQDVATSETLSPSTESTLKSSDASGTSASHPCTDKHTSNDSACADEFTKDKVNHTRSYERSCTDLGQQHIPHKLRIKLYNNRASNGSKGTLDSVSRCTGVCQLVICDDQKKAPVETVLNIPKSSDKNAQKVCSIGDLVESVSSGTTRVPSNKQSKKRKKHRKLKEAPESLHQDPLKNSKLYEVLRQGEGPLCHAMSSTQKKQCGYQGDGQNDKQGDQQDDFDGKVQSGRQSDFQRIIQRVGQDESPTVWRTNVQHHELSTTSAPKQSSSRDLEKKHISCALTNQANDAYFEDVRNLADTSQTDCLQNKHIQQNTRSPTETQHESPQGTIKLDQSTNVYTTLPPAHQSSGSSVENVPFSDDKGRCGPTQCTPPTENELRLIGPNHNGRCCSSIVTTDRGYHGNCSSATSMNSSQASYVSDSYEPINLQDVNVNERITGHVAMTSPRNDCEKMDVSSVIPTYVEPIPTSSACATPQRHVEARISSDTVCYPEHHVSLAPKTDYSTATHSLSRNHRSSGRLEDHPATLDDVSLGRETDSDMQHVAASDCANSRHTGSYNMTKSCNQNKNHVCLSENLDQRPSISGDLENTSCLSQITSHQHTKTPVAEKTHTVSDKSEIVKLDRSLLPRSTSAPPLQKSTPLHKQLYPAPETLPRISNFMFQHQICNNNSNAQYPDAVYMNSNTSQPPDIGNIASGGHHTSNETCIPANVQNDRYDTNGANEACDATSMSHIDISSPCRQSRTLARTSMAAVSTSNDSDALYHPVLGAGAQSLSSNSHAMTSVSLNHDTAVAAVSLVSMGLGCRGKQPAPCEISGLAAESQLTANNAILPSNDEDQGIIWGYQDATPMTIPRGRRGQWAGGERSVDEGYGSIESNCRKSPDDLERSSSNMPQDVASSTKLLISQKSINSFRTHSDAETPPINKLKKMCNGIKFESTDKTTCRNVPGHGIRSRKFSKSHNAGIGSTGISNSPLTNMCLQQSGALSGIYDIAVHNNNASHVQNGQTYQTHSQPISGSPSIHTVMTRSPTYRNGHLPYPFHSSFSHQPFYDQTPRQIQQSSEERSMMLSSSPMAASSIFARSMGNGYDAPLELTTKTAQDRHRERECERRESAGHLGGE